MKAKYVKPTCQIIRLPQEELFTSSVVTFNIQGEDDNSPLGFMGGSNSKWTGNSDGNSDESRRTYFFD